MSVSTYQALLADLEVYLNHEVTEWRALFEASRDRAEGRTFEALLDLKDELDRLKRLYFPTPVEDR